MLELSHEMPHTTGGERHNMLATCAILHCLISFSNLCFRSGILPILVGCLTKEEQ